MLCTEIRFLFTKVTEPDVSPVNFGGCSSALLTSHQACQPIFLHPQHCLLTEPSKMLTYMKIWPFKIEHITNTGMNFKYSSFSTQMTVPDFQTIWTNRKLFLLVTEELIYYLIECFTSLPPKNINLQINNLSTSIFGGLNLLCFN